MKSCLPHLMFEVPLEDVFDLWRSAVPDLQVNAIAMDNDVLTLAHATICGQTFSVFRSPIGHDFEFTPSFSLMITCASAAEVDQMAGALSEGATILMPIDRYDFAERFTWINDRFGMSWQFMWNGA